MSVKVWVKMKNILNSFFKEKKMNQNFITFEDYISGRKDMLEIAENYEKDGKTEGFLIMYGSHLEFSLTPKLADGLCETHRP